MKLIGMLDSPYVRRVAICLKLLKLDFEHRPVSVFRDFEEFRKLNPVVKAPTLILDDGQSLMDSTLILDYVTAIAGPVATSTADHADDRLGATRLTGLALAACEKTVQIVYERNLRPAEKQHEPWIDRVSVAQGRFEWNLTSSTIMASAVSDQILRKPMADVEPMH
jgi:glutathione S-transferase